MRQGGGGARKLELGPSVAQSNYLHYRDRLGGVPPGGNPVDCEKARWGSLVFINLCLPRVTRNNQRRFGLGGPHNPYVGLAPAALNGR